MPKNDTTKKPMKVTRRTPERDAETGRAANGLIAEAVAAATLNATQWASGNQRGWDLKMLGEDGAEVKVQVKSSSLTMPKDRTRGKEPHIGIYTSDEQLQDTSDNAPDLYALVIVNQTQPELTATIEQVEGGVEVAARTVIGHDDFHMVRVFTVAPKTILEHGYRSNEGATVVRIPASCCTEHTVRVPDGAITTVADD